jgi:hypothetical protein
MDSNGVKDTALQVMADLEKRGLHLAELTGTFPVERDGVVLILTYRKDEADVSE